MHCKLLIGVKFDVGCHVKHENCVKSLGVVLDDGLNFDKHINKVVSVCYLNLRNIGRIASKLSRNLKNQLVHLLILSHIDYCNALLYNLPAYLLHKLTKVLYVAVRFIFGFKCCNMRKHMLPSLKSLHILPVEFRILFKIALLTFKCRRGTSPQDLTVPHTVSCSCNLRVTDDQFLLKQPSDLNYKQSEAMFSYASCQVWNSLPRFLQEIDNVILFKKQLKYYYFDIAFKGINDIS